MSFRNYCIVIMGDTLGSQDEILKISETKPNILDAKGILIATFSSAVNPSELKEWFTTNNRSFLLFDLNEEGSGFNIMKPEIQEGLFGFLKTTNISEMNENFSKSIEVSSQTKTIATSIKQPSLEEQLQVALDNEDYEKAAEIRDILNQNTKP